MVYSKLQKILFLWFIQKNIENIYLTKYLDKLLRNVPMTERDFIEGMTEIELDIPEKVLKKITMVFLLHIEKPKEGFVNMLVKQFIKEGDVKFEEGEIEVINILLNKVLKELNLPELKINPGFISSLAYYSDNFERYLTQDS